MTSSSVPDPDGAELFDFVSMFFADQAEGTVQPLEHYLRRFPGHEAAITAEYQRLRQTEASTMPAMRRVGHYEIVQKLGSGGQGVVLLAEDTRLRRRVALKVLAPHLDFVSQERLQRFRREAELLSQLDHPGICQIYEADTFDGVPFLAMRYVEGRTLAAILRERKAAGALPRTRLELHEVVQWIETAARAVHEAHQNGVVHRDIKPGNLMITPSGSPVLLDFGLARAQGSPPGHDIEITRTGDVLGTLAYMAPELLARRTADLRADVYALGVTLYECLTHSLPFPGETQSAMWRAIENGSVTPARQHNDAIPADLAAVVATAMSASPAHRYASAEELALDLERVRRREPIRARPVPLATRAMLWLHRHPTLSTGLFAAAVLIVALATSLDRVSANERAARALNRALLPSGTDESAARALADLVAAAEGSPRTDLRNAMLVVLDACHLSWQTARTPAPAFEVDPDPVVAPSGSLVALSDHDGVIAVREVTTGRELARRRVHGSLASAIAFLDDDRLVSAGLDGIDVLAARDLAPLAHVPLPFAPMPRPADLPNPALMVKTLPACTPGVALTLDRRRLAVVYPGHCCILDAASWQLVASAQLEYATAARKVAFSTDGNHVLVLAKETGTDPHGCDHCWLVDVRAQRARPIALDGQAVIAASWHPDRSLIALSGNGGRVEILDATTGERRFAQQVGQEINWCGFDPSGERLLVPSDHSTELWRWESSPPHVERQLLHPSERTIGAAAFDTERGLFAAVLRDGLVLVYSTADWQLLRQFKVRMRDVRFLGWMPTSGSLLTADMSQLCCWLAGARPHSPELWGHRDAVTTVAVHPDGRRVLTGSRDRTARLWSLDHAAALHLLAHPTALRRVRFSPSGETLLTVAEDADVRLFATKDGAPRSVLHGHTRNVADAWFLRGDDRVCSIGDDGQAIIWDAATGAALRTMSASNAPLRCADFASDRPWLAVGGADRHVTVWDFETGAQVRRIFCSDGTDDWRLNPVHQVRGIAFDPSSNRLFASLVNNYLITWQLDADWREVRYEADRYGSTLVDEPRGGQVLAADYSFGRLTLIRGDRPQPLQLDGAEAHSNVISAIRVDRRSHQALSASHDGQLFVWDLESGKALQTVRTTSAILDADFSPDGEWVVTGSADGRVKLWSRDPLTTARSYLARRRTSGS